MIDIVELAGSLLLFLLVFGMSATVDMKALLAQVKNKKAILTGCFLQFGILPLLGFAVVKILNMNETMGITLLVVTSSPGGSYSNWWCSMFNADLALSVTMTAISTMLSCVALPANLLLYSRFSYDDDVVSLLDWPSLFTALIVVIGAIALGLICSAKIHSHRFNVLSNKLGNIAGISLVLFSALVSNSGGEDFRMWNRDWKFYVGVALPCFAGLIISNVMTSILSLKRPERVTVSIECCYQNVGIATSVALTMFEGADLAEAMGVPFYYGILEAVILGVYCIGAWKMGWTKAPPNAPFCHVIATSYEVIVAEKYELQAIEVTLSSDAHDNESLSDDGDTIFAYFRSEDDVGDTKEPSGLHDEYYHAHLEEQNSGEKPLIKE
mmetsp:Transcript_9351/g.13921  ORF Transcript_9351/g.13921 Transcript_9351/m.13921 type:complete len:382 (-) Transcript_9351:154-1299(-)|eukprot:CAMPEP_0203677756 /NCGR_PEP_ID=MMETSP0090-20130426/29455_1 /ASSEMBLY_ACC=CAM_ASM_001088 /TAXON_ID=426623 /ORGANISM="Chaetoceros affinis, Strain CCMP159" /LENGTH=381 /DNA_ID=CAMNT_0050544749 /DNA_START=56 /DNA_END=1201 /DNA_ORIENTATION=+